ncbi:MAG: LuxR family transcriptional regulator [Acidimicrobiales bacterium]
MVIDNCEHVVDVASAAVLSLVEGCPRLRVLTTSREVLRIPCETVITLGPLDADDAIRLFAERASAVRADAVEGQQQAVRDLCTRLEGVPLALELAAARVSVLAPAALLARLRERFDLLTNDRRVAPARHRSLRATIEWSYELLTSEEQVGFTRLSIFPGLFTAPAAETVGEVDLSTLASLVSKSLVSVVTTASGDLRYRMLDTLRSFGREKLASSGDPGDLHQRHLLFFLERAEAVNRSGVPTGAEAQVLDLCDSIDDLRAALGWSLEHDTHAGLRLIGASREVWFRRAQTEGLAWAVRLLERCPEKQPARIPALITAGVLSVAHQSHPAAAGWLEEAAQLAEQVDDAQLIAVSSLYLGTNAMLAQDLDAADILLVRALRLFEQLDMPQGAGRTLGIRGVVQFLEGDLGAARGLLIDALSALDGCDDPWGQGQSRTYLGLIAKATGDQASAEGYLAEAVRRLASTRDPTILGVALTGLSAITVASNPRRAIRLAGAAVGHRERVGGRYPAWTVHDLEEVKRLGTDALGPATATAEWDAGRHLDPTELDALLAGRAARSPGPLSPRELDVAALVTQGLTNGQIARRLHLSERTVENHISRSLSKLAVHNRVALASWFAALDHAH